MGESRRLPANSHCPHSRTHGPIKAEFNDDDKQYPYAKKYQNLI